MFRLAAALPFLLLALLAGVPAAAAGLAGVWENRYGDNRGNTFVDVLELRAGGAYVTHLALGVTDHGRYAVMGQVLSFRSDQGPAASQDVRFELRGDVLHMTLSKPPGVQVDWHRSSRTANFTTVQRHGRAVPAGLRALVGRVLADQALPWRDDAVPTTVRVREAKGGGAAGYDVELRYYSPSARQAMVVRAGTFARQITVSDATRSVTLPLTTRFLDLPQVLDAAAAAGVAGPLKRADLQTFSKGSAWRVTLAGQPAVNFEAAGGQRLRRDISGYVNYDRADWRGAGALWRQAAGR
ncbi:MAG: hypothetical protein H6907_05810 [Hyphomicrobiales bacterium]|nr:hypothetical protein [Hyphomicrobiales bacterium]